MHSLFYGGLLARIRRSVPTTRHQTKSLARRRSLV